MSKTRISVTTIIILIVASPVAFTATYPGQLGVECPGNVFVDMVKQSYNWSEPNVGGGWKPIESWNVDANGWPEVNTVWTCDYRPAQEWFGEIDDPEVYRVDYSGSYKCSFKGQADVTCDQVTIDNLVYDSNTNTTTFDMTVSPPGLYHGFWQLVFENTKRTPASPVGSGLTEFKAIRPGYPADTNKIFTNIFTRCLKNARFSTIRFMGVANTNGNVEWDAYGPILQSWSIRKKTTDAAQTAMSTLRHSNKTP